MIPPRRWEWNGVHWVLVEQRGRSLVMLADVYQADARRAHPGYVATEESWLARMYGGEPFAVASAEAGREEVDRRLANQTEPRKEP